jgi:hypothetical protein
MIDAITTFLEAPEAADIAELAKNASFGTILMLCELFDVPMFLRDFEMLL